MTDTITILSLEKTKKKGQYKVYTNVDDYIFDEDVIAKYMIFKDKEFEAKDFVKIVDEAMINNNFNKALKYLSYGDRSKYEIIKYLKGTLGIAKVVDRLTELGYLNDEKLAKGLIEYYKNAYKGPLFIISKLQEKCIDENIIKSLIRDNYSSDEEKEICQIVIDKNLANLREYPINKQKTMLLSKLTARGFHNDIIYSLLQSANYIDESDATIKIDYKKIKDKFQNKELSDKDRRNKIIASLMSKGYDYQKILKVLE